MISTVTPYREAVAQTIIGMERSALERWAKGDPDGFLEICDDNVVYFDPFQPSRVDGLRSLKEIYDGLRGQVQISEWQMINPNVYVRDNTAVLTFQFVSDGNSPNRWNTTEVYCRDHNGWKIVHTHWSLTQPKLAD